MDGFDPEIYQKVFGLWSENLPEHFPEAFNLVFLIHMKRRRERLRSLPVVSLTGCKFNGFIRFHPNMAFYLPFCFNRLFDSSVLILLAHERFYRNLIGVPALSLHSGFSGSTFPDHFFHASAVPGYEQSAAIWHTTASPWPGISAPNYFAGFKRRRAYSKIPFRKSRRIH